MSDLPLNSDDVLRRAVDRVPALIGCWDRSLLNLYANRVYAQYFGLEPTEILGMHIREVLGEELFRLNMPFISGVLGGEQQQFDRAIRDVHGIVRNTQATYTPDVVDGAVVGFTALVVDVSDRVGAERERDRALRLFQVAMENAPIGKAVLTRDGRWLQVNRALCELLGYSSEELLQLTFRDITHPDDIVSADAQLRALLDGTVSQVASEKRYLRKDSTVVWVQRNATIVGDSDTGDVIVAQIQDISARKTAEENLEREVLLDDLTGLANRRRLMAELTVLAEMSDTTSVGVLFVDVDAFKSINDRYGHAAGDVVLAEMGVRIRENTRDADLACRVGGDEFVIVVRSAVLLDDVERLAVRMRTILSGTYRIDTGPIEVTVSVGWSWNPDVGPDVLLRDADERMYRSKRS